MGILVVVECLTDCQCVVVFLGMLLRMFVLLYDTEVVEEEAFLKWKEDVSEKHPGKGKALFQVIGGLCSFPVFIHS